MTMIPPPFDPELAAALEAIKDMVPRALTMDEIPAMRRGPGIQMLAQLDLTMGGSTRSRTGSCRGPRVRRGSRC